MNNDNLHNLYENLRKTNAGFTASEDQFREMMQDENNRRNLHANLAENVEGFSADFDSFNQELGFDKPSIWRKISNKIGEAFDSMAQEQSAAVDPYSAQYNYHQEAAENSEENKAAKLRRMETAELPMTDADRQNLAEVARLGQQGSLGTPNSVQYDYDPMAGATITETQGDLHLNTGINANQGEIDRLKAQQPSYLTRSNDSEDNIVKNITEAWSANTPEGRQALAAAEQVVKNNIEGYRRAFEQSSDYRDVIERLQEGRMTEEQARKELDRRFNYNFGEIAAKETLDVYNQYKQAAIEANKDFYEGRMRDLAYKTSEDMIRDTSDEINKVFKKDKQGATPYYNQYGINTNEAVKDRYEEAAEDFLYKAQEKMNAMQVGNYEAGDFSKNVAWDLGGIMKSTATFGLSDLRDRKTLTSILEKVASAAEKAEDPEEILNNPDIVLNDKEKAVYDAYCTMLASDIAREADRSYLADAAKLTAEMIPFMLEVGAMNGIFGKMNSAAQRGIARGMTRNVVSKLPRGVKHGAAKMLTGATIDLATAGLYAAESGVMSLALPRTYANMLQNQIDVADGGIEMSGETNDKGAMDYRLRINDFDIDTTPKAFLEAWRDQWKEMFTETGGLFNVAGNLAFKNPIAKKVLNGINKSSLGEVVDLFNKGKFFQYAKAVGYHGTFKEWLEEVEGTCWDYAFGNKNSFNDFFKEETQIPMLISFSVPAVVGAAVNAGKNYLERRQWQKATRAQHKQATENVLNILKDNGYSAEDFADIKKTLYTTPVEDLPQTIISMASALTDTEQFGKVYQDFVYLNKKQKSGKLTDDEEVRLEADKNYLFGNETPEKNAVKTLADELTKLAYSEVAMASFDKGTQRERDAAVDEAVAYYDEIKDQMAQEPAQEQETAGEETIAKEVNDTVNTDGYIYAVADASDPARKGYIIRGDVSVNMENPQSPHLEKSNNMVIVRYEDGTIAMRNANDLELLSAPVSGGQAAAALKEEYNAAEAGEEGLWVEDGNGNLMQLFDTDANDVLQDVNGNQYTVDDLRKGGWRVLQQVPTEQPAAPVAPEQPVQSAAPVQKAKPDAATMSAQDLAVSTIDYLNGDKETAKAFLQSEYNKAKKVADSLNRKKVTNYTDIEDFKRQNDELNAQKKAANELVQKLGEAIVAVDAYEAPAAPVQENAPVAQENAENTLQNEKNNVSLQEYLDSIASEGHKPILFNNGNLIETLTKLGANKQTIDNARETLKFGVNTIEGFYLNGYICLNEETLTDTDRARSKYVHERQHLLTKQNPEVLAAVMKAAPVDELKRLVRVMSASTFYDNFSSMVVADEFISFAMEEAYKVDSDEELENVLRGIGANEELINIIKQLNNEQRRSESLRNARRNAHVDSRTKDSSGEGIGDSEQVSDRNLGQGGVNTPEQSERGVEGGGQVASAGEQVEQPTSTGKVSKSNAAEELRQDGIEVDTNKGDANFAVKDVLNEEQTEQAVKDLMTVTGRSEATVRKWLKAEQSLAKIILDGDNAAFLDLQVDESVPSIWKNSDYPQGTVEFSNICRKRLPFTMIYQRLQKEFPNRVFDASTLESIRGIMKANGRDVACGLCYVEDRRQLLGEIGKGFIDALEGKNSKVNDNQKKALDELKASGDNYVPTLYDILTLDGMKKLRKSHPAVAQAFVKYNNARGMQSGRLFQAYSAYHREILGYNKARVKSINDNGGLRIFSFSDFEAHHLIDLVQVITDCASKGIKIQGYTKVPEFAKAIKDTKVKLNRSLIAKGKGYVPADYVPQEGEAVSPNVIDGKRLLFDTVEGINVNHPDFFDASKNDNVGNILVGINDEQIKMAMLDPFVDYIIPFHTGIDKEVRKQKGIGDWVNYETKQNDKVLNDNGKLVNARANVNIYTDVLAKSQELIGRPIKNTRDFQTAFFKAVKEAGMIPRFYDFAKRTKSGDYTYTAGYEKFLIDFKMFDENGKYAPQEVVVPIFDNEFNTQILNDYVAGEKAKQVDEEIYQKIKEELGLVERGNTVFSVRGYDPANDNSLSPDVVIEMADMKDNAIADGTFMKAPNGNDSNLDERQWLQVRTRNFKKMYGDWENDPENATKILDENGEPKVAYHQTNAKQYINKETGQNWDDLNWREKEEWRERDDWDEYWEAQDFNIFSNRHGRHSIEYPAFFFSPEYDEYHEYGDRTIASFLNIKKPAIDPTIENAGVTDTAAEEAMNKLIAEGYDGVIRTEDGVPYEYIAFYPNQIKSATNNNGEFVEDKDDIRFSVSNQRNDIFYSNAERAVENIRQEKATPAQWLAMIEKAGGLKAGEDKWLGLSDWLKSQTQEVAPLQPNETAMDYANRVNAARKNTISKQEVLDYIRSNKIQIEEMAYEQDGGLNSAMQQRMDEINDEFMELFAQGEEETGSLYYSDYADWAFDEMIGRYGDDFSLAFQIVMDGDNTHLEPAEDWDGEISDAAYYFLGGTEHRAINDVRLQYTTEGLTDKREIALTVPTIESWNESDRIHFGDAGEGRAVAWARFGDAYADSREVFRNKQEELSDKYPQAHSLNDLLEVCTEEERAELLRLQQDARSGERAKVLVIDEIQSKRHQEGREHGYRAPKNEEHMAELKRLFDAFRAAEKAEDAFIDKKEEEYNVDAWSSLKAVMSEEDKAEYQRLQDARVAADKAYKDAYNRYRAEVDPKRVPEAPFEKNWHELALKRMLRFAAENGYDKLAWTTGEQQAQRYNLGFALSEIISSDWESDWGGEDGEKKEVVAYDLDDHSIIDFLVNRDGVIALDMNNVHSGEKLSDVVGKDLTVKLLTDGKQSITGDGLRIGAEGMRGFYDDMLPRFLQKYGKKWGAKVGEVTMPRLQDGYQTMHSIDITPEMRDSVLEGQPMFSVIGERGAANLDKAEEATVRLDNLRVAREMEDAGKDKKEIRLATGWERGGELKWRYEIPDVDFNQNAEIDPKGKTKLSDVLTNADEIFAAYPELKDYTITWQAPSAGEEYGSFDPDTKTITLSDIFYDGGAENPFKGRDVLVHELQHAIQHIEGFAQGGSPEMFSRAADGAVAQADKWIKALNAFKSGKDYMNAVKRNSDRMKMLARRELARTKTGQDFLRWVGDSHEDDGYSNYDVFENRVWGIPTSSYQRYRSLGGEVESRNVQSRLNMTPDERRDTLLRDTEDIAREDQEFITGEETANSNYSDDLKMRDGETAEEYSERVADEVRGITPKNTSLDDAIRFSIKVNHNSPYLLKKADGSFVDPETGERLGFDFRFMSKGEGNQAHGWGSYFSKNDIREYAEGSNPRASLKETFDTSRWQQFGTGDAFDVAGDYMTQAAREQAKSLRKWLEDRLADSKRLLERYENITVRLPQENVMVRRAEADVNYIPALLEDMKQDADMRMRHHYTVDIPDNDGSNYYTEEGDITDEEADRIIKVLSEDPRTNERINFEQYRKDKTREELISNIVNIRGNTRRAVYNNLSSVYGGDKAASEILSKAGFAGIHYNGYRDGECYVIFNENDAVITDHVRFAVYSPQEDSTLTPEAAQEMEDIQKRALANGTYMQAPKGKPTNLTEHQWLQVQTDDFKRWFDGSKVVDENGEPLVVYKRIVAPKDVFGKGESGIFFSNEPIQDESFGDYIQEAFLNMKNPLRVDAMGNSWSYPMWLMLTDENGNLLPKEEYEERVKDGYLGIPKEIWDAVYNDEEEYTYDEIGAIVKKHNLPYDGVIMDNIGEGVNGSQDMTDYIVFESNQIKSATDNIGTFDPDNENIRFSVISDPKKIEELDNSEKRIGYRNVVLNPDGTLGSPMAKALGKRGKKSVKTSPFVFGAWEQADENPDMATDDGKIDLVKGKVEGKNLGTVGGVDYNPYIHIRPTTLNKQFKQAWMRPNLVYIETEYPASELNGEYKAEKAKLPTGAHDWNGGILILSRYDRPARIVPWEEVAPAWIEEFKDRGVEFDIVPQGLRPLLVEAGVEILPPHAGMGKDCNDAYEQFKKEQEDDIRFAVEGSAPLASNASRMARAMLLKAEQLNQQLKQATLSNTDGSHNAEIQELQRQYALFTQAAIRTMQGDLKNAMKLQKTYDKGTVDSLVAYAQMFIHSGWADKAKRGELRNLLGAIRNGATQEDIVPAVQKMLNIFTGAQLRQTKNIFDSLLKTPIQKVNISGVKEQGKVGLRTQYTIQTLKDVLKEKGVTVDEIGDRITELQDKIDTTQDDALREQYEAQLEGLMIAERYMDTVVDLEKEADKLKKELAEANADKSLSKEAKQEWIESIEQSIFDNEQDQIAAYQDINRLLTDVLKEGVDRAKTFIAEKKASQAEIRHFANSDLKGIVPREHITESRLQKFYNGWMASGGIMSPLGSLNSILKRLAPLTPDGKGYLYNHFIYGAVEAAENEAIGLMTAFDELDDKVSEIFGRKMTLADAERVINKLPKIHAQIKDFVIDEDENGEKVTALDMRDVELTQGQAAYIYMVNKMQDGKTKLRRMGVTEEDVKTIEDQLDPRLKELCDWIQSDFLTSKRNKYNAVHERLFGAPMSAIENYFPLRIMQTSRSKKEDVAEQDTNKGQQSGVSTGAIKQRVRNSLPLDVLNSDMFSVLVDHLQEMEHWAAYAQLTRDANQLLSYNTFKRKLKNMTTVYGAGNQLFDNLKKAFQLTLGTYQPVRDKASSATAQLAKGLSTGAISLRIATAIKQVLSHPAFWTEVTHPRFLASYAFNIIHPYGAVKWGLENLPLLKKRWNSRAAGDTRILDNDDDWTYWHNRVVEFATRLGMSPNGFVDLVTCAQGAKAYYDYKLQEYKEMGMSDADAQKRARLDAEIFYNETQQSSEGAFIAPIQKDRTWQAITMSLFNNANFAYQRRAVEHLFQLRQQLLHKDDMIKSMTKMNQRLFGMDEEAAGKKAKNDYNHNVARNLLGIGIFYYAIQQIWRMGSNWMYVLAGGDPEEKKKIAKDASLGGALAAPVRGFFGGRELEALIDAYLAGRDMTMDSSSPLGQVVNDALRDVKYKRWAELITDITDLLAGSVTGIKPSTISSIAVGLYDTVHALTDGTPENDLKIERELLILFSKFISLPQSQLEKLYIDELGCTAKDVKETLTHAENKEAQARLRAMAERYIDYKKKMRLPLTGGDALNEDQNERISKKYEKRFDKLLDERYNVHFPEE